MWWYIYATIAVAFALLAWMKEGNLFEATLRWVQWVVVLLVFSAWIWFFTHVQMK